MGVYSNRCCTLVLFALQAPGQSKEALLLRHARASQPAGPAGPTVYSAR
jgi:hypothetical protein